jgi:NitT/TauT family transport system permease protein
LITNIFRSLGLNLAGYVEAIVISLGIGFIVGLYPLFRGMFNRQVDAFRYVPLTAVTGLFITWFGLGIEMKTHFLAFGILIYLLPIVVQRIDEVEDVFLKTVYTLGATDWQTIRSVYIPAVMSRLWDDIRVLTAISWTYIIIAESLGNQGGLGSLIYRVGQRQGNVGAIFAIQIPKRYRQ